MKISIVMANYNRRKLLINSLKTIEYYNKDRDIEVFVVDDCSSKEESVEDVPKLFSIPVFIIPITKEEKNWMCCCMPFNIGFSYCSGDIIIIQNPENLHVGDIVGYAIKNIQDGIFLSFALLSFNQHDTDNLINNAISKKVFSGEGIKKVIGELVGKKENWKDGDTCWYNHSKHQPSGCHLISAITRNDLEDLNGFDERYGAGFAYDDMEFRERIKRKGMVIKIIDYPFAIHQRHELAKYQENNIQFRRNGVMYTDITMRERTYRAPNNSFYSPQRDQAISKCDIIMNCPISGEDNGIEFLNLGNVPLVNNLCATKEQSLAAEKFPLSVQLFTKSRLTTLVYIVNKDDLFLTYFYRSGINKPFLKHCEEMYDFVQKNIPVQECGDIIDIGGNDGTLLSIFKKKNSKFNYINIDASKSFIDINKENGIQYVNKFFDENYKSEIKADLIISTNVFQHTEPIRSFVKGIRKNINEKNGVWLLEFPYLLTTLMNDNYDQIYHEHVYYYLLSNIVDLLKQEGMKVINVTFHNIHSGTLRVLSACDIPDNKTQPDLSVETFLSLEKTLTDEYYIQWGNRTYEKIEKFKKFIIDLHNKKASIACFGAAAKGCVFLNSCDLDHNVIKFIVDDTPYKQGKFVPGTGLQIVPRSELKKVKIDYLIILAHNFKDYIIDSLKGEYSGKYIVMFPDIKII
jgi:hypothetical protein